MKENSEGPSRLLPGTLLLDFRRNPIKFLERSARDYGDIVHFKVGRRHVYFVSNPDLIYEVLVSQNRDFVKRERKGKSRRGEGLITTASDFSLRHRPLVSPSFHRDQLSTYAQIINDCYTKESQRWKDGDLLDVHRAMLKLTLLVIGKTLFRNDFEDDSRAIGRSMNEFLEFFSRSTMPLADLVERLPLPSNRNFATATRELDAIAFRLIDEARKAPLDSNSLMSRLVNDVSGGKPMSDSKIRDEALTILLAGHETTGNALTWTWYLLSQHPDVEQKLHLEVDEVLQGRAPTTEDLPKLRYTEMVFNESLRLYPPVWLMMRQAARDVDLGGRTIKKGSLVLVSQFVTHRDSRFFSAPESFEPERWVEGHRAGLPRFAFFPFGGGPRTCIGEPLARLEGVMLLARVAQHWRFVAPRNL